MDTRLINNLGGEKMQGKLIPTKTEMKKWQQVMGRLQTTWEANYEKMDFLHEKPAGIRSTQIGALVMMLIKMEIIK